MKEKAIASNAAPVSIGCLSYPMIGCGKPLFRGAGVKDVLSHTELDSNL